MLESSGVGHGVGPKEGCGVVDGDFGVIGVDGRSSKVDRAVVAVCFGPIALGGGVRAKVNGGAGEGTSGERGGGNGAVGITRGVGARAQMAAFMVKRNEPV